MVEYTLPRDFSTRGATLKDVPIAVELFNEYHQHYFGYHNFTKNIIETDWQTPKFNPETDIHLVFSDQGQLVGYIEVWTDIDPPAHPFLWMQVHPEFDNLGIGSHLLQWGEDRARQVLDRCPQDIRVAYRISTESTMENQKILYNKFDLSLRRHSFRMLIEFGKAPPEPVWPHGIDVRFSDGSDFDIENLCRVDHEAFKDHFGYIEQPFSDDLAWFSNWVKNDESLADPSLWFLALMGEKPVGMALCSKWSFEKREYGHVNVLGVLKPYRNKGIGLALLHHTFSEYFKRGKKGVTLGVDAQNLTGALNLYKKAGMHVHRQYEMYEKELRPGREISVESINE